VPADEIFMSKALSLAARGRGRTSPNPMVGALVVDGEGIIVGRGAHAFAGGPHAEVHALEDAGSRARGATLYCTLEPCCHTGRTGPCAPKVVEAGVRRAVVAVEDPNPLVAGRGIDLLKRHGVAVTVGVGEQQSARLNAGFFSRMRRGRPFVTIKVALTLDGCVALAPGAGARLTGPAADRVVHAERAEVDAIAVGSGTVLADNPLLTARGVYRQRLLTRVIFDRRLRTPPDARLLSTAAEGPVIIMSEHPAVEGRRARAGALAAAGARIEWVGSEDGGESFLAAALERLGSLECNTIVVEGGPTLHLALWNAGLVDRIQVFQTPRVAGSGGVRWDVLPIGALADGSTRVLGDDILIEGHVHRVG
jgi:diaminohydroxyphosphoribosylaminopyrimidine deaminase/5-amino-6-(5-phosphoribosylamino)uracil reductase